MKKNLGGFKLKKADYDMLLLTDNSRLVLDQAFVKKLCCDEEECLKLEDLEKLMENLDTENNVFSD